MVECFPRRDQSKNTNVLVTLKVEKKGAVEEDFRLSQ